MKKLILILLIAISFTSYSQTTEQLRNYLTKDIEINFIDATVEPYVIVSNVIDSLTNYRAVYQDNKHYIPIATYTNNSRNNYTTYEELKIWAKAYGIKNVYCGKFSDNIKIEE